MNEKDPIGTGAGFGPLVCLVEFWNNVPPGGDPYPQIFEIWAKFTYYEGLPSEDRHDANIPPGAAHGYCYSESRDGLAECVQKVEYGASWRYSDGSVGQDANTVNCAPDECITKIEARLGPIPSRTAGSSDGNMPAELIGTDPGRGHQIISLSEASRKKDQLLESPKSASLAGS